MSEPNDSNAGNDSDLLAMYGYKEDAEKSSNPASNSNQSTSQPASHSTSGTAAGPSSARTATAAAIASPKIQFAKPIKRALFSKSPKSISSPRTTPKLTKGKHTLLSVFSFSEEQERRKMRETTRRGTIASSEVQFVKPIKRALFRKSRSSAPIIVKTSTLNLAHFESSPLPHNFNHESGPSRGSRKETNQDMLRELDADISFDCDY